MLSNSKLVGVLCLYKENFKYIQENKINERGKQSNTLILKPLLFPISQVLYWEKGIIQI